MTDPTDPLASFDAAQARLERIAAEARANSVSASRLSDAVRTTHATARSPRGELTVTSRAGGVVTAVEFSGAALELAPAELGRLTVATIAEAQHAATTLFAELTAEELAATPALADALRADAERAFPPPGSGGLRY